ncbi:hypothetical protein [Streptomyces sp. NPDC007988]|uniref:hypothetical protein n=1 Tax=Streptomyces sp. NPDC007988 TaxID=3364802 RepID=UPI0036F153D8
MYQVHDSAQGLRPGDLLIPMSPDLPALLIRPEHVGSLMSSGFLALRPKEGLGIWIWALLSSRTGRLFRSHLATSVVGRSTSRAALLDLELPLPPLVEVSLLSDRLAPIERASGREEEEASETWWRAADVSDGDWSLALATRDPVVLDGGIPLGDLCEKITRGRFGPQQQHREEPAPAYVAVTDIQVLGGKPVRRWVSLEAQPLVLAHPGDVLLAAVGARPHAMLAVETTAVDRNVYVLRLRNPSHGPAIVHYLNGQVGYGIRQMLLAGGAILSMRRDNLARLPVQPKALEYLGRSEPVVPLDVQLEQALWS